MREIRWQIGFILIIAFFIINFFVFDFDLKFKLMNIGLFSALFVLIRTVIGPSPADRIVAVDILGILVVGICALMAITFDQSFFIDIAMAWALQSFIATLALAKFLEGRHLDD
ncbi:MAG: cation:proton antiporter [Candidatus Cloacimonetes bacterium]|nr:cation:proton antiporter [Candidatus Cloacimonadota bacterium]